MVIFIALLLLKLAGQIKTKYMLKISVSNQTEFISLVNGYY